MKLHVIVSIKLGREGGPWATSHYLGWAGGGQGVGSPLFSGQSNTICGTVTTFRAGDAATKKISYIGYFFLVYTCQFDNMNYQIIMSGINQQRRF